MARDLPAICTNCPTSKAAKLLGDFWLLLVVRELLSGPKRFGELRDALSGISSRTLTLKLTIAEESGLLTRTEYAETPPRVLYAITKEGKRLRPVIKAIESYAGGK